MERNIEMTKEEAVTLVGGEREYIHAFKNPNGMLVGADWDWKTFLSELDSADEIVHAGEAATQMKHPLAVRKNDRWTFFERVERC